jgi:hypothetical protein
MESAFGWTQVARSDVAKAAALLKNEEQGVRDEIGFLTLHQGFADRFFPGTSVLQTRLRYALFVPWQIEDLEGHPLARSLAADQRLRASERRLVLRLKGAGDGVIGLRSTNYEPAQPPSMIYWTALRLWGILNPSATNSWPGRGEVLARMDASRWSDDREEGMTPILEPTFFALPNRPDDWSTDAALTFRLSPPEKRYLVERVGEAKRIAPGSLGDESLLARLAKSKKRPSSWVKAGYAAPLLKELADKEDRAALEVAIAAASLAHIGRAAYSAMVERMAKADGRKPGTRFAQELEEIVEAKRKSAHSCELAEVEAFIGKLDQKFHAALANTLNWLESPGDVMDLWKSYCDSEQGRKGTRARLPKTAHAETLRTAWMASDVPKAESLNYRWHRVGAMLDDLHDLHV